MIKMRSHLKMGKSEKGWLHSIFHFSFAEYYNPENMHFGTLRVVNDDIFNAGNGFDTHPHQDMEIISYVVDGTLTHKDSMGNERILTRGQVQYMSAGTGIMHSEMNHSNVPLRFLQIWILPDEKNHTPRYGDYAFAWEERLNTWLHITSNSCSKTPVKIHQDMNVSVTFIEKGHTLSYTLSNNRQAYLIQIEGKGSVNGHLLDAKDAVEIQNEAELCLYAQVDSHYILFDMPK